MQKRKHLYHLPARAVSLGLAMVMAMSTALTGCSREDITSHALETEQTVPEGMVSLRETLSENLDDELAGQAAEISDEFWENDVPADGQAAVYEYAYNEGVLAVTDDDGNIIDYTAGYETGASVNLSDVDATTVEKGYDGNGLRETIHEVKVMYTTVDEAYLTTSDITDMWDNNNEAFISNIVLQQRLYEVDGYDDCYVAFLNYSELNGTSGRIVDADFTRGTEKNPVDMSSQVVFDREKGVLYVPKAWYFAGDGSEISLDLCAQVMVAVDIHDENLTDEYGNLLVSIPVTVENNAGADTVLETGRYSTIAYDYVVLPLFAAGSVSTLSADDVKVYVNGSAEPMSVRDMGYNPDTGELTINIFAMSVSEIKVVFNKKSFLDSVKGIFSARNNGNAVSIGNVLADDDDEDEEPEPEPADLATFITNAHSGMRAIYNVSTGEELRPNIDLTELSVGDVLAYATLGNYGSRYSGVADYMWSRGCSNFVYTSNWGGALGRSDTYWMFVGNQGLTTDLDYTAGKKDNYGFIIELPFSDEAKEYPHPILMATSYDKMEIGKPVYFGVKDDWKWTNETPDLSQFQEYPPDDEEEEYDPNEFGDPTEIRFNYSIPGQCSHTEASTYKDGHLTAGSFKCTCNAGTFSCTCNDPGCVTYRASRGLAACDGGCPTCRGGGCSSCKDTCKWYRLTTGKTYCDSGCKECSQGRCSSCKDTIFRCSCSCAQCISYRNANGLSFCDMNCPHCSSGSCEGCSTKWMNGVLDGFTAQASIRILVMADGYMVLGLAQLDSGDCQRGTSVIKVRTSVKVTITKKSTSTLNNGTAGNSCYAPLSDSEYTIYKDEAMTNPVGTIKGDGVDNLLIPVGTYYVKETRAPKGYYMDTVVHRVDIRQNSDLEFYDDPMDDPMAITLMQKNLTNRDTAGVTTGDVGALGSIQFDVYYYKGEYSSLSSLPAVADEHAVFQTGIDGKLRLDNRHLVPGETWKYKSALGNLLIPLGTVVVKEKSAIDGLLISNPYGLMFTMTDMSDKTSNNINKLNYTGTITTIAGSSNVNATEDRLGGTYENNVAKGGVTVTKADLDWNRSDYQGDATLAGAEFTIYNRSASSVWYKGHIYNVGDAIDVLTTAYDANTGTYTATTGAGVLEYGTYEIRETKAPTGYNLADWSRTFTIRQDGQMHHFIQAANADTSNGLNWYHKWCNDAVMRGGVTIGKVDRETMQYTDLGSSRLEGTTFQITNRSEHAVRVNGRDYAPGSVVMNITTSRMEFNGRTVIAATTGNNVLPYGTYEIREIGTGTGYLYDTDSRNQSKTFQIRAQGEMIDLTAENDAFHNRVQREDWYFQKKADDIGERMDNVAWTVTSVSTGETHVIVTNENGAYDSEFADHTCRTNSNDPDSPVSNGAIGIDGEGNYYVKDASKLDCNAGTWFTGLAPAGVQWAGDGRSYTVKGGTGTVVSVDDAHRAYPYDTYIVQELRSEANEGYKLVRFTVTLKRFNDNPDSNGIKIDYGTVDDQREDATYAMYTNLGYNATGFASDAHSAPALGNLELTDVITYAGTTAGEEYTMKGTLHLLDENDNDLGIVAANDVTFMAKSFGQVSMAFNVDASGYVGKSLVATEELWQGDRCLAHEDDLTNDDQRVWISGVTATRAEKTYTSTKAGTPVTVTDSVDYVNLERGTVYTLTMTLMDKATGEAIRDNNDNAVTAETMFMPGTINGTVDISVTFEQPEGLAGTTAVVFEEISRGDGNVYGEHKDLNDNSQTVSFIDMIDTYAVNAGTFTKEISADKDQSIYDCIRLYDMKPGMEYKLEGSIYWIDDDGVARSVPDGNGNPFATVVIEDPETEEAMVFEGIDASGLGGRDIVVYQMLYARADDSDDWEAAFEHCEIFDADQTVHVPVISTMLTGETGIHHAEAGQVTLTDRVDYRNLVPGQTYTMTGALYVRDDEDTDDGFKPVNMGEVLSTTIKGYDPQTGEALYDAITVSATFVPESRDGYVDLVFTYDASALKGKVVVAFEELYTCEGYDIPDAWAGFFESDTIDDVCEKCGCGCRPGDDAAKTRLVASHTDIADTEQSVGFATITSTELTGDSIYTKIVNGVITIIETLTWDGLIPGHDYDIDDVFDEASESAKLQISTNGIFTPESVKGSITVSSTRDVQTEVRKDVLLAKDNIMLTDVVKYEGLIPGTTYDLTGRLMIKNEDGTLEEEPLMTMEGTFVPESVNGTIRVAYAFDATNLAGKTLVAFERISYDGILVAAHEDPDDENQTVRFPRVDTTFEGQDPDDSHDEPVKTIEFLTYAGHQDTFGVGQLQVETIDIVDTINYTNLIPGLTYTIKGEVHLKGNYNELHDFIKSDLDMGTLYVDESVTFTPDKPNGTLQMVFHVVPLGITAADLVAYEYLFIDDELIGMHADITDEAQTVTIIGKDASTDLDTVLTATESVITNNPNGTDTAGDTQGTEDGPVKTVEYYMYGGHRDKTVTLMDTVSYQNLVIGSEHTLKGEIHIKNRYGADMGTLATGDDIKFTPDTDSGTLTMTFVVDPADLPSDLEVDEIGLVAYEYLYEGDRLVTSHARISDSDQTVTLVMKEVPASITTTLSGTEAVVTNNPNGSSNTADVTENTGTMEGTDVTDTTGETVDADSLAASVPDAGDLEGMAGWFANVKAWAGSNDMTDIYYDADVALFLSSDQDKVTEYRGKLLELLKAAGNGQDTGTGDDMGTVEGTVDTMTGPIKTVEYYTYAGHGDAHVTLVDTVVYENLIVGEQYTLKGDLHVKNRYGDNIGVLTSGEDIMFVPSEPNGTLEMVFDVDPAELETDRTELVAYEYLYEGDELVASHTDISDSDQTVTLIMKDDEVKISTEMFGIKIDAPAADASNVTASGNSSGATDSVEKTEELVKSVEYNAYDETDRFGETHHSTDKVTLVDTVSYINLIPGETYRMEGEIHFRGRFGLDMGNMGIENKVTFTPEKPDGTVEVRFEVDPMDIRKGDLVAFEYLYEENGTRPVASHADISDDGQTVSIALRVEPEDPEPSTIDTVLKAVATDKAKTGTKTGTTVKIGSAGAPKATETPKTTEERRFVDVASFGRRLEVSKSGKTEVKVDTVTLVDTITYKDLTPDTEYTLKGEIHIRDVYGRDMGIISSTDVKFTPAAFEGTIEVSFDVIPKGVDITNLVAYEYLYKGNELVASHADIHDEDQTVTIVADGNICGCSERDCAHRNEEGHCLKENCCDDADCCKDCKDCKHSNPCGCDDPNCVHRNEKDHCKKPGCCDDANCCKGCKQCKPKPTVSGNDPTPTPKPTATPKPTNKPSDPKPTNKPGIVEIVKTGQDTFLLAGIIGLAVMAGGGYFFFTKTPDGRWALKKIREKLSRLFRK